MDSETWASSDSVSKIAHKSRYKKVFMWLECNKGSRSYSFRALPKLKEDVLHYKAPKQKKCNKALYGESYICPASLSWVNTELGEWQPTPLLSLIPYVASALLEAGWKMRRRVPLPMHTCKAQKSSHIYCTNYPPPHRHTNSHTSLHSWNRKLSPSFPSKLLSLASHFYQNHTVKPKAQAYTAKTQPKYIVSA